MIEVAKQMPDVQFTMIVTPVVIQDYERLVTISEDLPNLTVLSNIPFNEVEQYYALARILVNTSSFEGFPNTFLQAGKYGVPIISLRVDPNRMISEHGCGLACNGEVKQLKTNLCRLLSDSELYARLSENIIEYVRQNHDINKVVPQYETVFQSVLK